MEIDESLSPAVKLIVRMSNVLQAISALKHSADLAAFAAELDVAEQEWEHRLRMNNLAGGVDVEFTKAYGRAKTRIANWKRIVNAARELVKITDEVNVQAQEQTRN